VFEQAGQPLVLKDVPIHMPKEGEVLIKVAACGVCHGDLSYGKGAFGDAFPRIPGHEVGFNLLASNMNLINAHL
jgi:D-arabinose 1-dehydrogenase-like Zn-dependent alcohol dehydrogenase